MAIARQQFDILDRQIELRAFGVFQQQTFMGGTSGGHHLHPQIAADAVIHMHDQIAGAQRLCLGQEILGPPFAFRRADQAVAKDVLFRDDGQFRRAAAAFPRGFEPVFQRPNRQMQPAFADAGAVLDGDGLAHAFVFDQPSQPLPRAVGIAGDDHRPFLKFCFNMCDQGTEKTYGFLLPFGGEVAPQASARIQHMRTCRLWERLETDHAFADQRGFPRGVGQVQPLGRCGLIDAVHFRPVRHRQPAGFVLIRDTLPP